jgi:UDP-N-acetylglucosamine/UDP-N-acetylgalactosamine diphosphorylase
MIRVTSEADKVCVAKANEAGQEQIFEGWEELSAEDQRSLIAQVERIDFQLVKRLVEQRLRGNSVPLEGRVLKPARVARLPLPEVDREEYELSRTLGEYTFRNEEVLFVTAAGGALAGSSEPVGMLPVGPVTGKSIFQLHAEKILALSRRYRTSLRWSIFCHPGEVNRVSSFFKANGYFGLKCSNISILPQDLLPVVDRRGKILLTGPGKLAMSPNGHGGILLHLLEEERLQAIESWGIKHLFYFQVDNPLVNLADSLFLGHHIKNQLQISSKAVRKTDPGERVGVFCQINGGIGVVEYLELSDEDRQMRLPNGELALSAANMGVHVFSVEFLREIQEGGLHLPFHAVERRTPCLGKRGKLVRPAEPNSIQFNAFIFDALRSATRTSILEVEREDEFSPVKNAEGPCSPETVQRDLSRLYARWLKEARNSRELGPGAEDGQRAVEISPLFALDAEELKEKLASCGSPLANLPRGGNILLGERS